MERQQIIAEMESLRKQINDLVTQIEMLSDESGIPFAIFADQYLPEKFLTEFENSDAKTREQILLQLSKDAGHITGDLDYLLDFDDCVSSDWAGWQSLV